MLESNGSGQITVMYLNLVCMLNHLENFKYTDS